MEEVEDLTTKPGEAAGSPDVTPPHLAYVERTRERMRGVLACLVLACVPMVVLTAAVAFLMGGIEPSSHFDVTAVKDFAVSVLSPVVGLSGAVLGFYFGLKHER
jgi:hypothetical protein